MDDHTRGVYVGGTEHKIMQFADGKYLFDPFDRNTIVAFGQFQNISSCKVNFEKSKVFPIDSHKATLIPIYKKNPSYQVV